MITDADAELAQALSGIPSDRWSTLIAEHREKHAPNIEVIEQHEQRAVIAAEWRLWAINLVKNEFASDRWLRGLIEEKITEARLWTSWAEKLTELPRVPDETLRRAIKTGFEAEKRANKDWRAWAQKCAGVTDERVDARQVIEGLIIARTVDTEDLGWRAWASRTFALRSNNTSEIMQERISDWFKNARDEIDRLTLHAIHNEENEKALKAWQWWAAQLALLPQALAIGLGDDSMRTHITHALRSAARRAKQKAKKLSKGEIAAVRALLATRAQEEET